MPEITAELTPEERLEAIGESVAELDEIFNEINPQNPEYQRKLKRDLGNWENDQQGEVGTIKDYLLWRITQGL